MVTLFFFSVSTPTKIRICFQGKARIFPFEDRIREPIDLDLLQAEV